MQVPPELVAQVIALLAFAAVASLGFAFGRARDLGKAPLWALVSAAVVGLVATALGLVAAARKELSCYLSDNAAAKAGLAVLALATVGLHGVCFAFLISSAAEAWAHAVVLASFASSAVAVVVLALRHDPELCRA